MVTFDMLNFAPPAAAANRRRNKRSLISIAVKLCLPRGELLGQASNISVQGLLLAYPDDDACALGEKLWLQFSLPGALDGIRARAEVIRTFRHGRYSLSAVRFCTLALSHRRMIQRYIRRPTLGHPTPAFMPPPAYD